MNFRESMEEKSRSRAGFSLIEALCMTMALVVFTFLLAGITKPYWADKGIVTPTTGQTGAAAPSAAASKK